MKASHAARAEVPKEPKFDVPVKSPWGSPGKMVLTGLLVFLFASPMTIMLYAVIQTQPFPPSWFPLAQGASAMVVWTLLLMVGLGVFFGAAILTWPFMADSRKYLPHSYGAVFGFLAGLLVVLLFDGHSDFQSARERTAERAQPLIAAIERYRDDHGRFPEALALLVPNYVHEIPYTGMVGYPEFEYRRSEGRTPYNGYELWVDVGVVSFEKLVFWPEGSDFNQLKNVDDNYEAGGWACVSSD